MNLWFGFWLQRTPRREQESNERASLLIHSDLRRED